MAKIHLFINKQHVAAVIKARRRVCFGETIRPADVPAPSAAAGVRS